MNETLKKDVKKLAMDLGADLVGIGSVERFEKAPEAFHPAGLLPRVKSIISIALRIPHGVLVPQKALIENYPYQILGYGFLSHIRLNWISFEVTRFLEDKGFLTLPFPSFCEEQGDPSKAEKRSRPYKWQAKGASISHRHSAVAAGLGEISWSNLFISPRFGTKQRLVTILTTAKLPEDPLCPEDICDKCMLCVKSCPMGALSSKKSIKYDIAGKKTEMAIFKKEKCFWCHGGLSTKTFGEVELAEPKNMTMDYYFKMRKVIDDNSPMQVHRRFVTFTEGGYCGMCLIDCPKGTFNPQ